MWGAQASSWQSKSGILRAETRSASQFFFARHFPCPPKRTARAPSMSVRAAKGKEDRGQGIAFDGLRCDESTVYPCSNVARVNWEQEASHRPQETRPCWHPIPVPVSCAPTAQRNCPWFVHRSEHYWDRHTSYARLSRLGKRHLFPWCVARVLANISLQTTLPNLCSL